MKIVVVEDNRIEMKNIEYIISTIDGLEIAAKFTNGLDAWEYFQNNTADILVTDIQMAKMDGIELIQKLSDEGNDIEKIIISGYADFNNAQNAISAGVRGYVLKPFLDDELHDTIIEAMDSRKNVMEKKSDYESLKRHFENSKAILREHFFRNLLLNSDANYSEAENTEGEFGVSLMGNYKTVITFRIINNNSEYGSFFVCGALTDFIANDVCEGYTLYPVMIDEKEISIIAVSDNDDSIALSAFIIRLKNEIISKYNIDTLVGISSTETDVSKLYMQNKQSRETLNNIIMTHKNIVMSYDELPENESDVDFSLSGLQRELKNVVFDGDKSKISALVGKYILSDMDMARKKSIVYCYINILEFIMNGYGDSFDIVLGGKSLWEKLMNFESIQDVNLWLKNITSVAIDSIHSVNSREMDIVKKIKDIIAERYMEHLTISELAGELNFSQKQLFRIFAKATGNSISSYITEYRIDMAKKMILSGEKIYSVGEQVGYHDKTYFRKVFKTYTGVTPQEFKNNMR